MKSIEPKYPDMRPKRTKNGKVRLGIHHTQILSSEDDIVASSGDLISQDNRTVDTASDWLIANMGTILRDSVTHNNLTYMHCNLIPVFKTTVLI